MATPSPWRARINNSVEKRPTSTKPNVARAIKANPARMNGFRRPKRSIRAPAKGCNTELTRPNTEISSPTRTVCGNGINGEGSFETKMGRTMNRMLFPMASPSRAAESAITTRFPPILLSLSKIIYFFTSKNNYLANVPLSERSPKIGVLGVRTRAQHPNFRLFFRMCGAEVGQLGFQTFAPASLCLSAVILQHANDAVNTLIVFLEQRFQPLELGFTARGAFPQMASQPSFR